MYQYTCNAILAFDLLLPLATARVEYRLTWPRPDCAVFETGDPLAYSSIQKHGEILNAFASGPGANWTAHDDMMFPLLSPADLREGFEPRSNLNLWEEATHQITFDGGKHWTNVQLIDGYFIACSDGKRNWRADLPRDQVVSRPEWIRGDGKLTPPSAPALGRMGYTVTGRISDPQPQQIERVRLPGGTPNGLTVKQCPYRHPPTAVCPHCQDWERKRVPATVGDTPACPMTDTCFDSDPSVVGE